MDVQAKLRYARITPRKMRLVADLARGLTIEKAHFQLKFSQKRGGKILSKLLDSAIANAKEKGGMTRALFRGPSLSSRRWRRSLWPIIS